MLEEILGQIDDEMLRIVAFALDAAVDAGLPVSEEQYESLLLEAGKRMKSTIGAYAPAYPEALERAVRQFVEEQKSVRRALLTQAAPVILPE